ncbi:hypothetical protein L211DRAFT_660923 [Terfezia boudieri ATCC MYA-4762]|uniref:Uncharacterized protein n=1 Tax=Terfezia boudieri ATCC MYA-4762 TaxID=1051890 RepID=A0A3N4M0I8_9PEZI|nr:hypothetical protein L211DRAFT_660923 [Terfezia boudieri ATCC MYA-4762]
MRFFCFSSIALRHASSPPIKGVLALQKWQICQGPQVQGQRPGEVALEEFCKHNFSCWQKFHYSQSTLPACRNGLTNPFRSAGFSLCRGSLYLARFACTKYSGEVRGQSKKCEQYQRLMLQDGYVNVVAGCKFSSVPFI